MDQIIAYIQHILDNGFAYISNDSVYFDTNAYKNAGYNVSPLFSGKLDADYSSDNDYHGEKKCPADFALWKKAKEGEICFTPSWSETKGRPGWHIECSAMASHIFGNSFDIHSGGIDLLFPHHNNEVLQANAHNNNNNNDWVKYFLHSGHLHIAGQKMSKSLKNFITIEDYLENMGTSRELRTLFLLHKWNKELEYSDNSLNEAKRTDKKINDFIKHCQFIQKEGKAIKTELSELDKDYVYGFNGMKLQVEQALTNDIDTQTVMHLLLGYMTDTYKYLETDYNIGFVTDFVNYLEKMMQVFGNQYNDNQYNGTNYTDDKLAKVIDICTDLREDIRNTMLKYKKEVNKEVMKDVFAILDDVRDNKLTSVGIKLEDRGDKKTKLVII